MNSSVLLLVLIGIWLAFLLPIWMKRNSSPHLTSADNFSKAIATLRDNRVQVDASGNPIQTQSRTAPKAGSRMSARRRRLAARRRAFGGALMMLPTALLLSLLTGNFVVWALPVLGFVLAVAYARHTIKLDRANKLPKAEPSRSLLSGLGAAGRAAAERLLQTERLLETENTPAWQSEEANSFGAAWQAPEPVLPTYTKVEQIDNGDMWNSEHMIDAANAQRAKARAELVADLLRDQNQALAIDDQPTGEISRIVGA